MYEFLDFFKSQALSLSELFFIMGFSCLVAIFHTLLFPTLFNASLRPKWLFFVLNPFIVLVGYFVYNGFAMLAFILLFGSVFVMGIAGGIRSVIVGDPETKYYRRLQPKKPLWKRIVIVVGVLVFGIVFLSSGVYAFVIIFAMAFLMSLLPSSESRFKKYQATLPSSKIRSLAMGLVEVEGKITTNKPLLARIEKIECIGYKYIVEAITKDKDGDKSYSEIFSETVCNPFFITDETGTVEVNPDNIEFIWIDLDREYSSGGKRYSQYLIKQNDHVLIIGKASVRGNVPIIEHENIKNVFGITLLEKVREYNTYKPLMNSFTFFSFTLAVMIAVLLISPILIRDGEVIIKFSSFAFKWEELFNFLK